MVSYFQYLPQKERHSTDVSADDGRYQSDFGEDIGMALPSPILIIIDNTGVVPTNSPVA